MDKPGEFFEQLEASKFRVKRPRRFIFLCGGTMNKDALVPPSAREEFLRSLIDRKKYGTHDVRLAEEVDAFYLESPYTDLIEFEIDIARISDVVLLFSEGYGSLAELGAFSQIAPIAERMLVVIQSIHYNNVKSFVRDGPVIRPIPASSA